VNNRLLIGTGRYQAEDVVNLTELNMKNIKSSLIVNPDCQLFNPYKII